MVQTMLKSANVKVKFIYEKALLDVNSIIYSNLTMISKGIGCSIEQLLNDSICQTKRCLYKRYADVEPVVGQINELLNIVRTNAATVDGFTRDDLKVILHFICTA